jgi:hypothetical protein
MLLLGRAKEVAVQPAAVSASGPEVLEPATSHARAFAGFGRFAEAACRAAPAGGIRARRSDSDPRPFLRESFFH